MAKSKYPVLSTIMRDNKVIAAGSTIALDPETDAEAIAALTEAGVLGEPETQASDEKPPKGAK